MSEGTRSLSSSKLSMKDWRNVLVTAMTLSSFAGGCSAASMPKQATAQRTQKKMQQWLAPQPHKHGDRSTPRLGRATGEIERPGPNLRRRRAGKDCTSTGVAGIDM